MAEEGDDVTDLTKSLKQLLTSFTPYIREAGSAEQTEQAILHLEESDENFHRYEFVKQLRMQIEGALGPLIDDEIEKYSIAGSERAAGQETVVSKIIDKILNANEYQALTQSLKGRVTSACTELINNFDTEFMAEGSDKSTLGHTKRRDFIFSDGESSLADSSMNQSEVMFMNQDQFDRILEKLDRRKPVEVRHDSMKKLLRVTSMDIQNCDKWTQIRHSLQDALSDSDQTLWNMSLKFVARSLSANSPSTRDIYSTLVEFLASQFHTVNKSNAPKVKAGLDCRKPEMMKLVKGFRLMNEFQQQVPQYWIRYPDKFLDEVLDSTLSLLSQYTGATTGTQAVITPIHFMALVDPRANWFIKWMHGHYSRAPLLKMMERHRTVIDNAVRSCLDYVDSRKEARSVTEAAGESGSGVYTGEDLEFLYFVHSISLLSRLLCYGHGRRFFFPMKLKDREAPITLTMLVVQLTQLLTDANCSRTHSRSCSDYQPCRLMVEMLRRLCNSETVCELCICQDPVTDALLTPIVYWLQDVKDAGMSAPTEASMLHVADILAQIASNSCGRRHLLYGSAGDAGSRDKTGSKVAVSVLSQFSQRAINGTLSSPYARPPTLAVIGNIIFVCRQLYSTGEGLRIMYHHDLHNTIATVWRAANSDSDRAATPTPCTAGEDQPTTANIVLWEDMLRDNLLNLAATPKGLMLLQQTGAINDCVSYMYSRYSRKMQVSRCEKFGYGYMMSQVTATSAGMVALQSTGLLSSMVRSLWNILESGDDHLMYIPRSWPVQTIDKSAKKIFLSLANVMSSYAAVYEILGGVPLPTKDTYTFRENHDSVADIMDRLVLVDTPAKVHSLFNYEQSHVFGLRLMSLLTSCLDTLLLLQTQYKFQQVLLLCQKENTKEDSSEIIIDMLAVERNYLLVKTYQIGGPSERVLPPRTLIQDAPSQTKANRIVFPYPLFSAFPIPKEYCCSAVKKSSMKQDNDLSRFLSSTKNTDQSATQWLEKCRKNFCTLMTTKPDLARGGVLQDLMERVCEKLSTCPDEAIFPLLQHTASESALKNTKPSGVQTLGVELAVRYGAQLKLVSAGSDSKEKLTQLLKRVLCYMKQQQSPSPTSPIRCLQAGSTGFDWFMATVFLMMSGSVDRAWKFLHRFSTLAVSGYVWTDRLHCSVHLPQQVMLSGIHPVFSNTCHHIECILQAEVGHVYSAFRMSGYSPGQICQQWLRQCFWNYLDWQEICHYICMCLVLGADYQVYVCVAILRHRSRDILSNMQDKQLLISLKEEPLVGFKIGEHLEYMQQLENKYRKRILPDMFNMLRP